MRPRSCIYIWYILHLPDVTSTNLPLNHFNTSQAGIPCAEISLEIIGRVACIKSASALRRNVTIFIRGCRRGTLPRVVRHALQVFREESGETSWLRLNWPFASDFLLLILRPLTGAQHFRLRGCTRSRKNALVLSGRGRRGGVREGMT